MSQLLMVSDRVLIDPYEGEQTTESGLVLPATVAEKERVRNGRVVSVGPGYIIPNPEFSEEETWKPTGEAVRYLPLQARPGDHAFFLKKDAVDITYNKKKYLIVQHSSILALVREDADDILHNLGDVDEERDSPD